jgi:uncharacterized integral membrane protein (TIGR00698 family)
MLNQTIAISRATIRPLLPGVGLTVAISLLAIGAQLLERALIGYAIIEGLVIALLVGVLWRTAIGIRGSHKAGLHWMTKPCLNVAVVLLAASLDGPAVVRAGPVTVLATVLVVALGLAGSIGIGLLLGLNNKLAVLVAVGNSICGNSAIAAVAPVIEADDRDVASSIALTAVLGVVMVLLLPLLIPLLELSAYQYGVLAGLTVYAIPNVLAATYSVSSLSGEVGTLVKLVRVLLLAPTVVGLSFCYQARRHLGVRAAVRSVPGFVLAFLVLAALRCLGLVPEELSNLLRIVSNVLMVGVMAALGLGVELKGIRQVGARVSIAVLASLAMLLALSIMLIRGLAIGSDWSQP